MIKNTTIPSHIQKVVDAIKNQNQKYFIVTLHRRENRGDKMSCLWEQINAIASSEQYNKLKLVYITHPAIPDAKTRLNRNVILLDPLDYASMVHLIYHSAGIITDSGGLQEEAVCANKKILVCRDTTERPETIMSGHGKLIDTNLTDNFHFLTSDDLSELNENPYGSNVCKKIVHYLASLYGL